MSRCQRGFTLLELLSVVVLLGLAATAVTVRMTGKRGLFASRALRREIQELDARARVAAQTLGPVALAVTDRGRRIRLIERSSGRAMRELELEENSELELYEPGSTREIRFDATGRSRDYRAVLRQGRKRVSWRVSGETGWIQDEEER
ncbi:MAG: prepilin-type N-terminal cleavage/methylation domain-containing protein [Planctomycetota bacterium]